MVIRYRNDNAIIIDSVAFNRKHSFNDSRLRASNIQLRTAESPDHAAERARITNYQIIILALANVWIPKLDESGGSFPRYANATQNNGQTKIDRLILSTGFKYSGGSSDSMIGWLIVGLKCTRSGTMSRRDC